MPTPTIPYTFVSGTLAQSAQVNANFSALVAFLTTEVIQKDASLAFTAVPAGPAVDPVSDNQLARKAYVDKGPAVAASGATPTGTRFTGSTTYVDWPAAEVFSLVHTKKAASTKIAIVYTGSCFTTLGAAAVDFAVKADAGADNTLARFFFNATNQHSTVGGITLLSGLSAAAHTYTLRVKVGSSQDVVADGGDRNHFLIMEVT